MIIIHCSFSLLSILGSIEKVQQERSKVLVIHAMEGEVMDFSYQVVVYEGAPIPFPCVDRRGRS